MNEKEYLQAQIDNPNFDDENVVLVDVEELVIADHQVNNEVRSQGLDAKGYRQTKHEIRVHGGNDVPIDVTKLPGGKLKPADGGGNRTRACIELWEETGDERYRFMKAVERNYSSPIERKFDMLNKNIPRFSQTEATHDDIVLTIHEAITEEFYFGSDYSDITVDDIKTMISEELNRKYHGNTISSLAQKVFNKLPHGASKYHRPVNDQEIVETFNDINPFGITLSPDELQTNGKYNWGVIVEDNEGQEWAIYCGKQLTWTKQNILHYAFYAKLKNPSVKVMTVCYNGSVGSTKNGECPIANFRNRAHGNMQRFSPSTENRLLTDTLVDYDIYLPQIVKGNDKEDMRYLYDHEGSKII